MNASRTSSFMMLEVVIASDFGVMYLGEPLTPRFFAGSLLILGCGASLMLVPVRSNLINPPQP